MNALHRKYAPELAQKEVNTRICIPMKQMLGMLKLDSLRQITDRFGVYLYSGKRKAEIIDSICHKFNREYLEKVMGVMSVEEFQYFSTYALDESPERRAPEISEKLKQLSARGLVQYEEARGYCVASEFMSIFEELYESGRETQYLHEKYMYTALLACRELYGLFDREMFCAVLGTFGDQGITEEEKTDYFKTFLSGFNSLDLAGLDEECCYYSRLLGKSEAVRIRKKMYPEKVYYLPDAEEIRDFTTKGLPVREADSKAYGVIFKKYTGYYSYRQDDSDEYLYSAIRRIHRGDTGEQVLAELMRPLYSLRWAKPAEKSVGEESLNKLIRQLELNTPLTELRGYSLKNCPKELKAHYEEQREKKATPPARNVKKAVAVKKNTRGKK